MNNWQQQYFVLYMYHILFIDYSVIGHLGCFRILAIVNSASVNIGVHISFRIMVFSGCMPRVGIAWSYGTSIFVFLSSLLTSHHRAVRVYMPQCRRVQFSHSVVFYLCNPMQAALQASLSITNSWSLLKFMSIESLMPSNHLILCRSLLLSAFPSIRVFSDESILRIRWRNYWSISFNIHPSNEYSGLISFRIDWFHLLAVQGTLKSLLQHHSSEALILRCSGLFIVQFSHPYMTTGKTIALTRWTFVGKVMSLNFNMMSKLVITFLPRSKGLLISWLQSPSAVILEPPKIKSVTVSIVSPSVCHEVMGPDAMIFVFWMLSFKPDFSLSSFTFIQRLFSSLLSAIRVVSSMYLRLFIFLLAVLIPACASSSPAFCMMYFACKLNKQGENMQPLQTPFPVWNQSVVPCLILTVASCRRVETHF